MKLLTRKKIGIRQSGMSLIELMIAMTLGIMMLSTAISLLVTNKRVYTEQNEMGALQENARFAIDLLVKDIRLAAFVGCSDEVTNVTNHLGNANTVNIANFSETATSALIEGRESNFNSWFPSASTESIAEMDTTSDGITIRHFQPTDISLLNNMATTADALTINNTNGALDTLANDSFVAISDCGGADIFQANQIDRTNNIITPSANLSRIYLKDNANIHLLRNHRYFIKNSASGTGPALWRATPGTDTSGAGRTFNDEELIEGVQNMQILYGENTNGAVGVDGYFTANAVTNWANVVSVKISLLMRTIRQYGTTIDTNTFNVLGQNLGPFNDRHRRRIFAATIEIRNRRDTILRL